MSTEAPLPGAIFTSFQSLQNESKMMRCKPLPFSIVDQADLLRSMLCYAMLASAHLLKPPAHIYS